MLSRGKPSSATAVNSTMRRLFFCSGVLALMQFSGCSNLMAKAEYQKAKVQETLQQYRAAIAKYEHIIARFPKSSFKDSAQIALATVTSPQFISGYVGERRAAGIAAEEALGDFKGLKIIWLARPIKGCVRKDLEGEPVEFKVGTVRLLGKAAHGLDRLKFNWFCVTNEEELVTIEGSLVSACDLPGISIVIGVNAVARQN